MPQRKVIEIDEEKCTGCGACVTSCAEGALQIVNGKAKVVNEVFCDGLGACIGECPEGALRIVEREAPEFDEEAVEEHLRSTKPAHARTAAEPEPCGCPSHNPMILTASQAKDVGKAAPRGDSADLQPELTNWPVQWRLVSSAMPFFKDRELLLAADCAPFAFRDFHGRFLSDKPVIIGCPKLDDQRGYVDKLADVFRNATPKAIRIVHMEVPCCHGLRRLVDEALRLSGKEIPIKVTVVGVRGQILRET
ncbi:MAG: 4Fe-4S binding protein [Candidatus Thermoplasmatota archaeon]|nr:4Fe-4S binding protein [Candidatus Thermoplasmatota archaeon]